MIALDIARNELRRMFHGPLAWIILAFVQFILAFSFLSLIRNFQEAHSTVTHLGISISVIAITLGIAGQLLLITTPLVTMRLISDERRSGTLSLLLSAPVSIAEVIFGKYLGSMTYFLVVLIMISLMPLSLAFGTRLDFGMLASGLLGLLLLSSSFTAIGLFASTLTRQPAVAAVLTFILLFLFWYIDLLGQTDNETLAAVFNYLSMQWHLKNLLTGIFNSVDVIYYLLLSSVFVLLSMLRLDAIRSMD